jgi:hypothetical protein
MRLSNKEYRYIDLCCDQSSHNELSSFLLCISSIFAKGDQGHSESLAPALNSRIIRRYLRSSTHSVSPLPGNLYPVRSGLHPLL